MTGCLFLLSKAVTAAAAVVTRKGIIFGSKGNKNPSPSQQLVRHRELLPCLPATETGTRGIFITIRGCSSCLLLLSPCRAPRPTLMLPRTFDLSAGAVGWARKIYTLEFQQGSSPVQKGLTSSLLFGLVYFYLFF